MPADDIARLFTFVAGQTIKAAEGNAELNQLVNLANKKASREVDNTFLGANTFSGATTFSGAVTCSQIPTLPASNPTTANQAVRKAYADSLLPSLIRLRGSARPVYTSATTFTLAHILNLDSANAVFISKATSTTVDITDTGLNGIAQSTNLAGAIGTGGVSSTTITGTGTAFSTDFVVGDVIWTASGARRITAIASSTSLTVESSVTIANGTAYRRGGRAPNTHYLLYSMTDGTTPGLILTTRNVAGGATLVDLPSGYTTTRQMSFAATLDGSSNIIPFMIAPSPHGPMVLYDVGGPIEGAAGTTNVVANGSATGYTTVGLSAFVPPIARIVQLWGFANGTNRTAIRAAGNSHSGTGFTTANGYGTLWTPTDGNQQIEYRNVFQSTGGVYLAVGGYVVTEVV